MKKRKNKSVFRKSFTLSLLIFIGASVFCLSAEAQTKTTRLSIASGATGGVYFVLGGGLATLATKHIPGVNATAEVTAASVDNCKLIMSGQSDLAFSYSDVAYDAYAGLGRFKGKNGSGLRTLAMLYPGYSHIVTVEGKGIREAKDLKGKRISTGPPGSGSEVVSLRILEALGINPDKDIGRERLTMNESAGALKDGKIDAFFVSAGAPMLSARARRRRGG